MPTTFCYLRLLFWWMIAKQLCTFQNKTLSSSEGSWGCVGKVGLDMTLLAGFFVTKVASFLGLGRTKDSAGRELRFGGLKKDKYGQVMARRQAVEDCKRMKSCVCVWSTLDLLQSSSSCRLSGSLLFAVFPSFCFGALQDSDSNFNHRRWIRCYINFQCPLLQFIMGVYVCTCGRLIEKGNNRMVFTNFVLNIDHGIAWSPEREVVLRFYASYRLLGCGWVVWWTSRWQKLLYLENLKPSWQVEATNWGSRHSTFSMPRFVSIKCVGSKFKQTRSKLAYVFTPPFAWLLRKWWKGW